MLVFINAQIFTHLNEQVIYLIHFSTSLFFSGVPNVDGAICKLVLTNNQLVIVLVLRVNNQVLSVLAI